MPQTATSFSETPYLLTFKDVTATAGVGDMGYGMGVAAADYDGDGDLDLYVLNYGPNVLYRNDGDGTFTDVTREAGLEEPLWSVAAPWPREAGCGRWVRSTPRRRA